MLAIINKKSVFVYYNKQIKTMKKLWTEPELIILRKEYPTTQSILIAKKLNRSLGSIYSQAKLKNLKIKRK
jgi:hypothetical protein